MQVGTPVLFCLLLALLCAAPRAEAAAIPGLRRGEAGLEAELRLDSWEAFFGNPAPITFLILDDEVETPEEHHRRAYDYVIENQRAILDAMLADLLAAYAVWKDDWGYADDDMDGLMPAVSAPADFAALLRPISIVVHDARKDGLPYIGYEFAATWDEEHGFGAVLHGTRIVDLGGGDTALLGWIARRDLEGRPIHD